jgi:hypothetical protein
MASSGVKKTREEALAFLGKFDEKLPACRFCERMVLAGSCCTEASRQGKLILADKDAYWLWDLDHKIWEQREHTDKRWQRRFWYVEIRGIMKDADFEKVKTLAPKYIVEPHNACMGFNFGISIYAVEDADVDIGVSDKEVEEFAKMMGAKVPVSKPIPLLCVTGSHFDTRFAETWARLSPLSHNSQNEAKLKKYGFGELKTASYYDY